MFWSLNSDTECGNSEGVGKNSVWVNLPHPQRQLHIGLPMHAADQTAETLERIFNLFFSQQSLNFLHSLVEQL